jgi:hypothetical protein
LATAAEVKGGLAVAAIALAVGALTINTALVGVFYDDGLYAGLATSIANGAGYAHPHLPGTPPAVHYPPLYPIVLAPFFGLLPLSAAALGAKLLNLILAAAGAGLLTWHAMRIELLDPATPRWVTPAIVGATAIAIPVLATQSVLFAEPLFGVLLVATVIAADRGRSPWVVGGIAALAFLTRSIGVAAAAGVACFLIARRLPLRDLGATLVPIFIVAAGWGLWVLLHEKGIDPALALNYGSYGQTLRQTGLTALGVSAPDLPRPLEALTLGWIPVRWLFHLAATATLAVGLYGLAILTRRSAIGYTLVFYLLILAVWPYPPDRFLWAVLPWLALAWGIGAVALWRRAAVLGRHAMLVRAPVAVLALLLGVGYARYEVMGFAGRWWGTQARAISNNFAELLPVLRDLPPESVIAVDDEALVWLYSGRRAVPLYVERYSGRETLRPTPAEHRAYLERMGVTHVVLASPTSPSAGELRAVLVAFPAWLTAVYRWPPPTGGGRWLFAVNRGQ